MVADELFLSGTVRNEILDRYREFYNGKTPIIYIWPVLRIEPSNIR